MPHDDDAAKVKKMETGSEPGILAILHNFGTYHGVTPPKSGGGGIPVIDAQTGCVVAWAHRNPEGVYEYVEPETMVINVSSTSPASERGGGVAGTGWTPEPSPAPEASGDPLRVNSRVIADAGPPNAAPSSGQTPDGKTWQDVPAPGSRTNFVRLTNEVTTPAGIGHPTNTGECPLALSGVTASGVIVGRPSEPWHLILQPGESAPWFHGDPRAAAIIVAAFESCHGHAQLTYDTPAV